eukprot:380594-Pelagomonas_calceolata.AAC.9
MGAGGKYCAITLMAFVCHQSGKWQGNGEEQRLIVHQTELSRNLVDCFDNSKLTKISYGAKNAWLELGIPARTGAR